VVDARGDAVVGARVAIDHVPTWLLVGSNREPGTGTGAGRFAVTDPRGHFSLREVPEGSVALEAYAPGVGRARSASVTVVAGRTTDGVHLAIARAGDGPDGGEPVAASGGVAVTLGETAAKTGAAEEVVLVSVVEGSEAERAGLAPGDVVLVVDGAPAQNMEEARSRLTGPVADDVLVVVRRGDRTLTLRVAREAVRR
jgi:membrane-associated protease RseP (regulator of RpoE activity)